MLFYYILEESEGHSPFRNQNPYFNRRIDSVALVPDGAYAALAPPTGGFLRPPTDDRRQNLAEIGSQAGISLMFNCSWSRNMHAIAERMAPLKGPTTVPLGSSLCILSSASRQLLTR